MESGGADGHFVKGQTVDVPISLEPGQVVVHDCVLDPLVSWGWGGVDAALRELSILLPW